MLKKSSTLCVFLSGVLLSKALLPLVLEAVFAKCVFGIAYVCVIGFISLLF